MGRYSSRGKAVRANIVSWLCEQPLSFGCEDITHGFSCLPFCPWKARRYSCCSVVDESLMKAKNHRFKIQGFKGNNNRRVQVRNKYGSKTVTWR
ncbi:hypothetical protein LXL04_029524 [Taraxacum kok-saghyz]